MHSSSTVYLLFRATGEADEFKYSCIFTSDNRKDALHCMIEDFLFEKRDGDHRWNDGRQYRICRQSLGKYIPDAEPFFVPPYWEEPLDVEIFQGPHKELIRSMISFCHRYRWDSYLRKLMAIEKYLELEEEDRC